MGESELIVECSGVAEGEEVDRQLARENNEHENSDKK